MVEDLSFMDKECPGEAILKLQKELSLLNDSLFIFIATLLFMLILGIKISSKWTDSDQGTRLLFSTGCNKKV